MNTANVKALNGKKIREYKYSRKNIKKDIRKNWKLYIGEEDEDGQMAYLEISNDIHSDGELEELPVGIKQA